MAEDPISPDQISSREKVAKLNTAFVQRYGLYIPSERTQKNGNVADRVQLLDSEDYTTVFNDPNSQASAETKKPSKWLLFSEAGARYYSTTVRSGSELSASAVSFKDIAAMRFYGRLMDKHGEDNVHRLYFGTLADQNIKQAIESDLEGTDVSQILPDLYTEGDQSQITADNTEGFEQGGKVYIKRQPDKNQTSTIVHEIAHLYEPDVR